MFRQKKKQLKVIQLTDNIILENVNPKKGINTLYWWNKNDYVKADLYDHTGDIYAYGLIGDTLQEIIDYVNDRYIQNNT